MGNEVAWRAEQNCGTHTMLRELPGVIEVLQVRMTLTFSNVVFWGSVWILSSHDKLYVLEKIM